MRNIDTGFDERCDLRINGYTLRMTSLACPEQYDVFDGNGVQAGYLRLRHGHFRADYPDYDGVTVYESDTDGDGMFEDNERMPELTRAIQALDTIHRKVETQ